MIKQAYLRGLTKAADYGDLRLRPIIGQPLVNPDSSSDTPARITAPNPSRITRARAALQRLIPSVASARAGALLVPSAVGKAKQVISDLRQNIAPGLNYLRDRFSR